MKRVKDPERYRRDSVDDLDDVPFEFRKQVSLMLPVSQWKKLRLEAARRGRPITAVVYEWVKPHLDRLPDPGSGG